MTLSWDLVVDFVANGPPIVKIVVTAAAVALFVVWWRRIR